MLDAVRTARVTAAHTVSRSVGVHARRALGCASKPLKVVFSNLLPAVKERRSGTRAISSCRKALKML
jgi:hypothetical protein